jgi:hypothetical protein
MVDHKAIVDGRGNMETPDSARQGDLLRALIERTSAKAPPSARRRAIALAGVRVARSIESRRGKA